MGYTRPDTRRALFEFLRVQKLVMQVTSCTSPALVILLCFIKTEIGKLRGWIGGRREGKREVRGGRVAVVLDKNLKQFSRYVHRDGRKVTMT